MLEKICDLLKDKITTLPYSDVVASLSRIAIEQTEHADEFGQVYRIDRKVFPVASNVSQGDCTRGAYQNLAPNNNKKSVMYFERVNDEAISYKKIGQISEVTTKLRLVVWLNLRALGVTITGDTSSIQFELSDLLSNAPLNFTHNLLPHKANITTIAFIHDPSIFTKYSYDKSIINNMLLYPYQYFAIDFVVSYTVNTSCLTFTPKTTIC